MSADVVLAAGGVLWRDDPGEGLRVALVHRPRHDDWSLPKGKLDPGEHLLETAVRELAEETGHRVRLGRSLGVTSYLSMGSPKRVHYWAAESLGGGFAPHEEIDDLRWLPLAEAAEVVDRDSDRAVLAEFLRRPVRTTPLIVLRHAKAVSRKSWPGRDEDRPLHEEGRPQADRLVGLLGAYDVTNVVTSPYARCWETVSPYLKSRPEAVERIEEALTERAHEKDPTAAPALLADLAAAGDRTVVCSHRPVLPALVAALRAQGDAAVDHDLDGTPLRTAEMVVAHVAGGRIVSSERHRA